MSTPFSTIFDPYSRQRGASLVEVMVAFTVLSIGLLGLALLQTKSLGLNTNAYLRSQATLIANELIENMRANTTANYVVATKPPAVCTSCSAAQKNADADIIRWYTAQEALLPSSASVVTKDTVTSPYKITMQWVEKNITVRQVWVVSL